MQRTHAQLSSPWPHDALQLTSAVERTARLIVAARHGISAAYGMTVPGWRMLLVIAQSGASITVAEAARRLKLTRQGAHRVVRDLCEAELLLTDGSSLDRRILVVALTRDGARKLEKLETTMSALLLEMTDDISLDCLEATTSLLNHVTGRLRRCKSIISRRGRARRIA